MARILIVDDDPDLLALMQRVLTEAAHRVTGVEDSRAVIEGAVGAAYDLVVTDMIMPGVDGLEMLAYLYRHNPDIKAIAISGGGYFTPEFHLSLASKFGAISTLEKPFQPSRLVSAVDRALRRDADGQDPGSAVPNPLVANDDRPGIGSGRPGGTPDREGGAPEDSLRTIVRIFMDYGAFRPTPSGS